jgi:hypothetical protein
MQQKIPVVLGIDSKRGAVWLLLVTTAVFADLPATCSAPYRHSSREDLEKLTDPDSRC